MGPNQSVVELSPEEPLFADWCDVWAASARHERPDDPVRPMSDHLALGRQLTGPGGSLDGTHRAVVVAGRVVGALRTIMPTRDNHELAVIDVAVRPGYRRQGLGTLLLTHGVRLAGDAGRTKLIAEVDEPEAGAPGSAFAAHHGWTCELRETRRVLALPPDTARLAALEADARAASRGYQLVTWQDRTPDDLVHDRAVLEQRMTTDAPHGDLPLEEEQWDAARVREYEATHQDRGRTVLSAGAVRDGRLVAFTDLQVPRADPRTAHQGGTLVLAEHRGHRLGALVKVAVLRQVLATQPEVQRITTYNLDDNAPMVAVNEALGFIPSGHLAAWAMRLTDDPDGSWRHDRSRHMAGHRIYTTSVASVYPHYVAKAERKGRTKAEVDQILRWLTGHTQEGLDEQLAQGTDFEHFFTEAPEMNPSRDLITGVVCGVRVEDIEEPTMREIRYLDKLVDELARGKAMEKILRA